MLKAGFAQFVRTCYFLYTMYKMKYTRIRADLSQKEKSMNLNVLRYIIEVEKSRSITGAAKALFISQPNLSRDIRELEEEIGFPIFSRSSRGVVPTEKGREFLLLAKKAVKQYQALESFCSREDKDNLILRICVPRTGCFARVLGSWLTRYTKGARTRALHISYKETDAPDAIRNVANGNFSLAIIRCPDRSEKNLLPLLRRKELSCEALCRYELAVVMSRRHPLAGTSILTPDMLDSAVQIVCDDPSLAVYLNEPAEPEHGSASIRVGEQGSLYELLTHVPGTYAFTSPLPESILNEYHLVQKKLQGPARKMTDFLIFPEDTRFSRAESSFLEALREFFPQAAGQSLP